jgi:hypothetical protein
MEGVTISIIPFIMTPSGKMKDSRKGFVFSGMSFLLIIPAIILVASLGNMVSTGTDITSFLISSNRVSTGGESIATDTGQMIEQISSSSTQKATRLALELSFSTDDAVPGYAAAYFDADARAFIPGESIAFILDKTISGVQEGRPSDFQGMNFQIQQAISNYSTLTGLNITLSNPDGDTCIPGGPCSVFNSNNVKIVPAPYGMYTLIEGDWRLVIVDNNTQWNLSLPARNVLKFNSSGTITSNNYLVKSYTSVIGFQDPLIWWTLSRWSELYRDSTVLEAAPDITTWPLIRSPVEPHSKIGNRVINQSNTSESFLNDLGNDMLSHRVHASKYGPTFFDMLEARWWMSDYYRDLAPLADNNERIDVGLESFVPNDPLKIENGGTKYSTLYHYYISSFFAQTPYNSYIQNVAPYNNSFEYLDKNLNNQSFAPPSLIFDGANFTSIIAGEWNGTALSGVYIQASSKEKAYDFLVGRDIYVDEYNASGYDNGTVNTAIRYNLTWAMG